MTYNEDNEGRQLIIEEDSKDTKSKALTLSQVVNSCILALSIICFTVGTACAQALGGVVPPFELSLFRYLARFIMVTPPVIKRRLLLPEKRHVVPLLLVCLSSWAFNTLYYTASTYLAVGTLMAGYNGLWLVFTCLVTLVVFRECTRYLTLAVISCLIGLILLVQPEFIFPDSPVSVYNPVCKRVYQPSNQTGCGNQSDIFVNESSREIAASTESNVSFTYNATHVSISNWKNDIVGWVLVMSAATASTFMNCVINKKLAELNALTLNFWVSCLGVVVSGITMAIFEKPSMPTSAVCVILLLGHALATAIQGIGEMTTQLVFSPAVLCIAFQMPGVLSYIAQRTFMEDINPGKQNAEEIAGVVMVIISNVIMTCVELYTVYVADPSEKN